MHVFTRTCFDSLSDDGPDAMFFSSAGGGGGATRAAVRRIEDFKNDRIIPHIVREEAREGNFVRYMHMHDANFHEMYVSTGDVEPRGMT